jgi:hypothetical protein
MPTCAFCEKELKSERGLEAHVRRFHDMSVEDTTEAVTNGEVPPNAEISFDTPEEETVLKRSIKERLFAAVPERKPRSGKRADTDTLWQTVWTVLGAGLEKTEADIPVGRCLQFQAPTVGAVMDSAIEGTFIDTLLQPIAQNSGKLKAVSSVVGMPALVFLLERNPTMAPALEPLLRMVIEEHLVAMVPVYKAKQRKDREYKKAIEELTELTGENLGPNPVDDILNSIFAMVPGQAEAEYVDATAP